MVRNELAEYDAFSILSSLGGLQVWAPNQAHTARLDEAARIACSMSAWGAKNVESSELQDRLNKWVPFNGALGLWEDPLSGPFTDIVVCVGGNYVVYPGINPDGPYILKVLFAYIFGARRDLPASFVTQVARTAVPLLTLSNQVAHRLGHVRYMDGPDTARGDIAVPPQAILETLARSVTFTAEELAMASVERGLDLESLDEFVLQRGMVYPGEGDPENNPLLLKPLVRVQDKLVVLSPGSVMHALRHFILSLAAEKHLRDQLAIGYRRTLWRFVQDYMRLLSLGPLRLDLPDGGIRPPVKEGLFQIDRDKVAYVQLITDDLSVFDSNAPCGYWDSADLDKRSVKRAGEIADWLTGGGHGYCTDVLFVIVLGSLGRDILFSVVGEPPGTRVLLTYAQDLEVVVQLRDLGNLRLWKFADADHRLRAKVRTLSLGFLDAYAVYKEHQDSFYLSDEAVPTHLLIQSGKGRALRLKALRMADVHMAPRFGPKDHMLVTRFEENESIPIYYPEGGIGRTLDRLIEGYAQPIWVECSDQAQHAGDALWTQHAQMANCLAYWIWQVTPSLGPHLEPLGPGPLRVNFRLQDALSWPKGVELPRKMGETIPSAPTRTIDRAVYIEIPIEFQILLHRPDNEADRRLTFQILEGLGTVLANNGCENTLTPYQCRKILDKHAPLGAKKKLVGVNISTRPAWNPDGIPPFRKLESHDVEEQLDDLALALEPKRPIGELHDAVDAGAVCNELVYLYLCRIKSTIQAFSWESLLRELVAQHEAYWHTRAYEEITTPTNIECYGNVESHVARLVRDLTRAEETAVALRLLIEIIAAEPPIGRKLVSMAEADRLVAMASHLINWGMLSDHIHLGIINYKLSILPSGRIGVDPKDATGVWGPFTAAKTLENVEFDISDFAKHFRSEPSAPPDPALMECLEKAFASEFGMTRTDIISFFKTLTAIGFELGTASAVLPKSELAAQMQKRLGLHEDYLNPLLNLFSLQPRPKWEQAPNGFNEREDIRPWRYNRRLSYLRRPLVVRPDPKNDPLVFWGPRHVDEALRNLLGLVQTGRYKLQPNSSKDMSDVIAEIKGNASKKYVREVKEWLEDNSGWEVHAEIPIRPGKPLHADDNLGDIDIFCIDRCDKRIFSIECKNVNFGRSPREIANELEKFLGKDDAKKQSWIEKHQKRHEWLKAYLELVIQVYALDTGSWQVGSLFLISEEISATYLRQMPLPFLSFPKLKREGLAALIVAVTS